MTFVRFLAPAALLLSNAISAGALAQPMQEFRDPQNRVIGKVIPRSDGRLEARSSDNRYLGFFDPKANVTYDRNHRVIARGNLLSALIDHDAQAAKHEVGNEQNDRDAMSRPWREGDPQYQPRYQHRVMPTPAPDEIPIVPPDVKARHDRMVNSVSQEDRFFAIDALQQAAESRGHSVFWRNPDSGNSGAYLVTPEFIETYVNGLIANCYRARMTLHVGRETDVQIQTVCQRPDNGVWTVAAVHLD